MSVFKMCERALGLIKGRTLEDLTQTQRDMLEVLDYEGLQREHAQEEAVTCVRHFEQVRDGLLQQYPFVFAKKSAPLAMLSDKAVGWNFSFQMPSDCLRPLQFISRGRELSKSKYEIMGRTVHTNARDVYLRYTAKITDTDMWDQVFVNCFCFSLASEIAFAVTGAPNASQGVAQQLQMALAEGYRVGSIDEVPGMMLDIDMYDAWNGYNYNKIATVDGGVWI